MTRDQIKARIESLEEEIEDCHEEIWLAEREVRGLEKLLECNDES